MASFKVTSRLKREAQKSAETPKASGEDAGENDLLELVEW